MYDSTKPYKNEILKLIKQTWKTPYVSVEDGVVKKKFSYPEYHHTDGIGTKGIYHWERRSLKNAVIDAMAMNLNDLAMMRAKPYALIDHLFIPEDDESAILEIISYLTDKCKRMGIAITGGETAIHNNMNGLEISITMLGFVENQKPNRLKTGNILIGIESNGIHSNGFTKVREIFGSEHRPEFIEPTNIYIDNILSLNKRFDVYGMMHITGGAFTKLKDILPENTDIIIRRDHRLHPQEIFYEMYNKEMSDDEIYKRFNCGSRFVIGVEKKDTDKILNEIKGFKTDIIGEVVEGHHRIRIESMFSGQEVKY